MGVAVHQDVCATFLDRLRNASSRALLLDYDGTLAPFTPDREHAFPYPEIPELVARIMRTGTRVVLISGRPATELLFLSGIHPHQKFGEATAQSACCLMGHIRLSRHQRP